MRSVKMTIKTLFEKHQLCIYRSRQVRMPKRHLMGSIQPIRISYLVPSIFRPLYRFTGLGLAKLTVEKHTMSVWLSTRAISGIGIV